MKTVIILLVLISTVLMTYAQPPVEWKHWVKKQTENTFEIHIRATIKKGWHLYAQQQPESGIAMPTTFTFNNNPIIIWYGKVKEEGKMEKSRDETLGVEQNYYSNSVDFIQIIELKARVKTNVSAIAKYQLCNNEMCLPMASNKFIFKIEG